MVKSASTQERRRHEKVADWRKRGFWRGKIRILDKEDEGNSGENRKGGEKKKRWERKEKFGNR